MLTPARDENAGQRRVFGRQPAKCRSGPLFGPMTSGQPLLTTLKQTASPAGDAKADTTRRSGHAHAPPAQR
jgi:hypothetical protein